MKIVTVVGARPQFVKAAPVSRELRKENTEVLVHTGQHYDDNMSAIFFDELEIPRPDYNLGIGSGGHGKQTGEMLASIERVLLEEKPDWLLVYGDTNSTLAGALAAAKLHIPVAHVEAGLRSFNRRMPEEINRVLTDHIADALFCPTLTAVDNLNSEGISKGVHLVGDVMCDALLYYTEKVKQAQVLQAYGVGAGEYYLATVHRAENTDNPQRLTNIVEILAGLESNVVFPVHPRTRKKLAELGLEEKLKRTKVLLTEPVGYLDMIALQSKARAILTDSGGVQKEAYMLGVPCITFREETEWVETVEKGWNFLVGDDRERFGIALAGINRKKPRPPIYGRGNASEQIAESLTGNWSRVKAGSKNGFTSWGKY